MWIMNLERCNRIRRKLSENFYVNFSCWTYWFLLIVYFSYLGFGAWMFVILERPTEEDKCEFVNEFGALYVNAGEEYVWSKYNRNISDLEHLGKDDTITLSLAHYKELLEVVKTGAVDRATMIADGCTNYWSFLNSYYFAGTVVTTLGYGNVYPATNPGKVFCICYAMIGVPLFYYIMKRTSDFLLEKFKQLEKCVSRVSVKFASAISLLVYVVGGFISCSLIPAVVFHHIEGWTLLQAWYFTMITLLTIGFGDYCPTADYTRYKAKHQGSEEAIEDHEHDSINQMYFNFYRIAVYIWTLLGLSWLGGLISLIVDSASKVALKSRPENESIEYKMDCGRYVNNVRVVLGRQNNNQTGMTTNGGSGGAVLSGNNRENNIVLAQRNNYNNNIKATNQPDLINGQQNQPMQHPNNQQQNNQILKKTKNTNFFNFNRIQTSKYGGNKDEQNCIICSESDHLCKQHRILLDK